ncbi:hypothetical protein [Novosphingobium sp.]|uniref:hypothetical protein n=1 Tax=Novosphingobium sp. TaxID=1874826 RepID=UPI00286A78F9|nr:hypothetical protein [Novosphingobium sp.]
MSGHNSSIRRRGHPLLALILLMVSWVGARAAMWEAPKVTPVEAAAPAAAHPKALRPAKAPRPAAPRIVPSARPAAPLMAPGPLNQEPAGPITPPTILQPAIMATEASLAPGSETAPAPRKRQTPADSAGHQELFSAAMSIPTIDEGSAMDTPRSARLPGAAALVQTAGSRWSGDAWLVLREGGNGFNAPGAGLPGVVVPVGFYGGSQAGAVLRYRLSLTSPLQPALYLRASGGLEYPRGEEVAVGFAVRPLARVPFSLMAEARVTRTTSGTIVRPAAAVVSQLPPAALPLGLRGEAYVQAGYVGGRDATAFVDGQARAEKPFLRSGRLELRAGGGAWGGAQRGANRLDVGPTATLSLPIGPAGARVSADYRIRVAGQAAPGSGAVLTLSAGF